MKEYGYTHEFECQQCSKKTIRKNRHKISPKYCSQLCSQKARIGTTTNKQKKIEKAIKSFEKNVIKQEGCWGWKGRLIHGYGYISTKCFGSQRSHRVSYILYKGEIPEGLHVLHSCHNRSCTNPDHLRVGTQQDNITDKVNAFRQAFKVSKKKVKAIQIILKSKKFSDEDIAEMLNISKNTVVAIKEKILHI